MPLLYHEQKPTTVKFQRELFFGDERMIDVRLRKRRIIAPPERLAKVFESLPRTDDFQLIE